LKAKELYYSKGVIAIPLVAPLAVLNQYAPRFLRFFLKPQEFPIVRAFAVLSALNLYEAIKDKEYLEIAGESVRWLIANKLEGYHGACWGLNMPWMTKTGYCSSLTPNITSTPYCFEALMRYHDFTDDLSAYDTALSSLGFLENDIKVLYEDNMQMAISYGPVMSDNIVINASSYAMMMYSVLGTLNPENRDKMFAKAKKLRAFILDNQNSDGSWWYYSKIEKGNFIDCFHSCIVLKNLIKSQKNLGLNDHCHVDLGLDYLIKNHLDRKLYLAKRFSVSSNPSVVKYDLYDQAELMNIFLLCNKLDDAKKIHDSIIKHFYMPQKGTFGSEILLMGKLNKMKYLRWAVMPSIYVISEYYKRTGSLQ